MRFSLAFTSVLCSSTLITALPPHLLPSDNTALIQRIPSSFSFDASQSDTLDEQQSRSLEKRRGGGGRGSGSSSSSGSSSGGRTGSGGRAISSYSFSPQSNLGGRTISGSGTPASYGGRYAGGAAVPFTSGGRSPTRSVAPFLLPIAVLGFFPLLWLYPVYAYPYGGYGYHWLDDGGRNRTANVTCLCQEYSVCGCDPDSEGNMTYVAQQLTDGKGSGAPVNSSMVRVVDFGTDNTTAYINGTLDNGTTAAGGTEPSSEDQISAAVRLVGMYAGYWVTVVVASLFLTVG